MTCVRRAVSPEYPMRFYFDSVLAPNQSSPLYDLAVLTATSKGRNSSRNNGYSSFASSHSNHRIGYRLRRSLRKTKKPKSSLQRKLRLLAHLLPLLHETLSIFNDLCQAVGFITKRFKKASSGCRHLPIVVLILLLISSFETILTLTLSLLLLGLHLYTPKIFKPKCKLRALPRISVHMCFVFQESVSVAAVGINLLSFRGGTASVTVWTIGLSIIYMGKIIGFFNALKLAILLAALVGNLAPRHGLSCLKIFRKQLRRVPGIELFQAHRSK